MRTQEDSWHPLLRVAIESHHPLLWYSYVRAIEEGRNWMGAIGCVQEYLEAKGVPRPAAYATASLVVRKSFNLN
jgi:hypothetical protein